MEDSFVGVFLFDSRYNMFFVALTRQSFVDATVSTPARTTPPRPKFALAGAQLSCLPSSKDTWRPLER